MVRALVILVALGGCKRADPNLVAVREALQAWEEGVAALEAGDPAEARERFAEAREHRPDDVLLAAWEAKAIADAGAPAAAVTMLDPVITARPDFAEARYNRAAYKARLGIDAEEVAADLRQAIEDGARRSREVLDDPDFAAYLDEPAFDFLPENALSIAVEAPESPVFWGSEFDVRLRVVGAGTQPIGVTAEAVTGPVELVRAVDESSPSTQGTFRDLTWTWRVVGAGAITFGPFHAWVGETRETLPVVALQAAAPPGREPPEGPRVLAFQTPSEVLGKANVPSGRVVEGDLLVAYQPGDRVVIEPAPKVPPVRYEKREGSRTVWIVDRYQQAGDRRQVTITRGGQAVFEGSTGPGPG